MYHYRRTLDRDLTAALASRVLQHPSCTPGSGRPGSVMIPEGELFLLLQHDADPVDRMRLFDALHKEFPGSWIWVTAVVLYPSQQIPLHQDPPLGKGVVRYHVPLQTNDGCWSFNVVTKDDYRDWETAAAKDGWEQLRQGRVYTFRPAEPHGAVNWGSTTRVHLMLDVLEGA